MGKATDFVDDLMARPLSAQEIRERQKTVKPATELIGTLDGQLVEPSPAPVETPRVVRQAPQQTWD